MSEEILKALTQLFAIITKQDEGVTEKEREFITLFFKQRLSSSGVKEYLSLYEEHLAEKTKKSSRRSKPESEDNTEKKLTSMKDSVRTLAICKKINKTLTQKQKVIVLVELLEMINCDNNFSEQRREIINTVAEVFNISKNEYIEIENFVTDTKFESENLINVTSGESNNSISLSSLEGHIYFLKIPSVDLIFVKVFSDDEVTINHRLVENRRVYLLSPGSIITLKKGGSLYYSDVVAHYNKDISGAPLSFNCKHIWFKFPNGHVGLRDINISESKGKLLGIMGASGAGKTTLLNVLAGIESPSEGEVLINGIDIHKDRENIKGVIGYIPQDDILIETLTVFENLYFNAKLCFKDKTEDELKELVGATLQSLGLYEIRDIEVGNVLNKKISGGQRKRLNIALELIREPSVLFVDEPTSGLSSRDSENVIDLLKELALKGKLIFVVIHQPSSDIYKKFDKMFIMDTGGYPIFYGNPIDAIIHFKTESNQINSDKGACESCGNVNPELMFDIIEGKIVNEYGVLTNKRKVLPTEWETIYREKFKPDFIEDVNSGAPNALNIPSKIKQWFIYTGRDLKSKLGNKQYLLINLLEAPLLAFVLAFIIRYKNAPNSAQYIFRYNENIPAYLLMSIVVALFMGLTVSAEEIIRDRKLLKREQFLNLSKSSYLFSKIGILFTLSAIQTALFVLIGNLILDIDGMFMSYWLVLFSISCFANILGLNISAAFNEVVNVYIVIPILLIPQMVLSGALFPFDKLHPILKNEDKVPLIADMMASRWAYEALAVDQANNNMYNAQFNEYDQFLSDVNYKQVYLIPEIQNILNEQRETKNEKSFLIVKNELQKLQDEYKISDVPWDDIESLTYSTESHEAILSYLEKINQILSKHYNHINSKKEEKISLLELYFKKNGTDLEQLKNNYFNESLDEITRNINIKERIVRGNGKLIRKVDPIFAFNDSFSVQFYTPEKSLFGLKTNTYTWNVIVIWFISILLYLTLYFDIFRSIISSLSTIGSPKKEE